MSQRTQGKLKRVYGELNKLPPARREFWKKAIYDYSKAGRKVGGPETEWDLQFANWLDRVYGTVAAEATKTRKEFVDATADASKKVGFGFWPLAVAALAIGYAWSVTGKARH